MLPRLRRSAGLLLILFVGHLSAVTGGAVCTTPGMAAMSAPPSAMDGAMADMGMSAAVQASAAKAGGAKGPAIPDHAPCSDASQGACIAGMPCVTALSAAVTESLGSPGMMVASEAMALTVTMPVTPGTAPDLPPPRVQV